MLFTKLKRVKSDLKELNRIGFSDIQAVELMAYNDMIEIQATMHTHPSDKDIIDAEIVVVQGY